jgi:hypothetical protein
VRGFYKGMIPNLYRVAPNAALTMMLYEKAKSTLNAMATLV